MLPKQVIEYDQILYIFSNVKYGNDRDDWDPDFESRSRLKVVFSVSGVKIKRHGPGQWNQYNQSRNQVQSDSTQYLQKIPFVLTYC